MYMLSTNERNGNMLNIRNVILDRRYGKVKEILPRGRQWRQMVTKHESIGTGIINTIYNPQTRHVEKIVEQYPKCHQVFWKNGRREITDEFRRDSSLNTLYHRKAGSQGVMETVVNIGINEGTPEVIIGKGKTDGLYQTGPYKKIVIENPNPDFLVKKGFGAYVS